jgi:cytochrome c peroxidase
MFVAWSCSKENTISDDTYVLQVPQGFPQPFFPADNGLTKSRVELGKKLFFDPALSVDHSVSCASCHLQERGFADDTPLSTGVQGRVGNRNAPGLANMAWMPVFMRDGGIPTLELQVLGPISDHNEMDFDIQQIVARLSTDQDYQSRSRQAYDRPLDAFVIMRALASFERTFVSGNSRYDQSVRGEVSLTNEELRGKDLFFSDTLGCGNCHSGFLFTNHNFENNGLYYQYADSGRARITFQYYDVGRFRVPSLRNVEVTAPYMHDGSKTTLEAVINHYAAGGAGHPNESSFINGFTISGSDKLALIAFLKSLTDPAFLNNPEYFP